MADRRDPAYRAAGERQSELLRPYLMSSYVGRLATIPVLGVALLLIWARQVWAVFAIVVVFLLVAAVQTVLHFVRTKQIRDETVGAYRRSLRGLPPRRTKPPRAFPAGRDPGEWHGLPPMPPAYRLAVGAGAMGCFALAVGLVAGMLTWRGYVVLIVESSLLVLSTVAVFVWFLRTDRAIWDYSSRWRLAAFGSLAQWRWVVLAAGVAVTVGVISWPAALAVRQGAPWFVNQFCGAAAPQESLGYCVPASTLDAALSADAGGNLAILGLTLSVAFLNSLGGGPARVAESEPQPSPATH